MNGPQGRQLLDDLDLPPGKRARLHRIFAIGARGVALLALADRGMDLGPIALAGAGGSAPASWVISPDHCSGLILHIGAAERRRYTRSGVPLLLKLNGKTAIPPDDEALAPLHATVEDAVRLGADAVVYTLYVGSPAQFEDFTQLSQVRQDCQRYGMPLVVQASPRGSAVGRKGGPEGLYALEYAASAAAEAGADAIIIAQPAPHLQRDAQMPKPYNTLQLDPCAALARLAAAAIGVPVVIQHDGSGTEDAVVEQASVTVSAGACGLAFGQGLWERSLEEAQMIAARVRDLLAG